MAAFLLYDKTKTWWDDEGQLLAGGYVKFYLAGTLEARDVYGNRALSTNNGDTIDLDASGRLEHECWADTANAFFVEVYNASDVKVGEVSYVEVPGGQAQVIPVPESGEYLTGDGSSFIVEDLTDRLLPDQTGHSNDILGTDGTTASWVARPADGAAGVSDVDDGSGYIRVGDTLMQYGTGTATAPGAGGKTATASITFTTAFTSAPKVYIETNNASNTAAGVIPDHSVTSSTTTGATIQFSTKTGGTSADSYSGSDITTNIGFTYLAVGPA